MEERNVHNGGYRSNCPNLECFITQATSQTSASGSEPIHSSATYDVAVSDTDWRSTSAIETRCRSRYSMPACSARSFSAKLRSGPQARSDY